MHIENPYKQSQTQIALIIIYLMQLTALLGGIHSILMLIYLSCLILKNAFDGRQLLNFAASTILFLTLNLANHLFWELWGVISDYVTKVLGGIG